MTPPRTEAEESEAWRRTTRLWLSGISGISSSSKGRNDVQSAAHGAENIGKVR